MTDLFRLYNKRWDNETIANVISGLHHLLVDCNEIRLLLLTLVNAIRDYVIKSESFQNFTSDQTSYILAGLTSLPNSPERDLLVELIYDLFIKSKDVDVSVNHLIIAMPGLSKLVFDKPMERKLFELYFSYFDKVQEFSFPMDQVCSLFVLLKTQKSSLVRDMYSRFLCGMVKNSQTQLVSSFSMCHIFSAFQSLDVLSQDDADLVIAISKKIKPNMMLKSDLVKSCLALSSSSALFADTPLKRIFKIFCESIKLSRNNKKVFYNQANADTYNLTLSEVVDLCSMLNNIPRHLSSKQYYLHVITEYISARQPTNKFHITYLSKIALSLRYLSDISVIIYQP